MKTVWLTLGACAWLGCNNPKEKQASTIKTDTTAASTGFKPYFIQKGYLVVDTGSYYDELINGRYAIIEHRSEVLDTIDRDFGLQQVGKKLIYLKLNNYRNSGLTVGKNKISASPGQYLLIEASARKSAVGKLAPNFDDYFSSPSVIENKIYYWSLQLLDSVGSYHVSAAQFNPTDGKVKFSHLFDDNIATDYRYYFAPPELKGDRIRFYLNDNQNWSFTRDFKLLD